MPADTALSPRSARPPRQRPRARHTGSLSDLEHEADDVFAGYTRIVQARARVESTLASLGGDEQAIWDTIAHVTKFASLVEGVNHKVDALQRIAERRVQQAAATSARRTSAFLSFLTALTIVTVAVDLLSNFIGSRTDDLGHLALRVAIVILAALLGIGVYREAYRDPARPASDGVNPLVRDRPGPSAGAQIERSALQDHVDALRCP